MQKMPKFFYIQLKFDDDKKMSQKKIIQYNIFLFHST